MLILHFRLQGWWGIFRGTAPKNRLTDIIEININNLAAVPSIIFGLLGLALPKRYASPRSAPIAGAWF